MDISKASNFERFVFDLAGRDPAVIRELWGSVDKGGAFDLRGTPYFERLAGFSFDSGRSTHQDRLDTIRSTWETYGIMIDPHTADGLKVAAEYPQADGVPLVVLETALPVKFSETIQEALGREPERPAALEGIESLPQHVEVMAPDVEAIKAYMVARL